MNPRLSALGRLWVGIALLGLLLAAGLAQDAVLERDVAVPMRDGVRLRAHILRPAQSGRFPVLVYRTPYGKDSALETYGLFRKAVERGYAVVVQDVRGRYSSDGDFRPYHQEGKDGYDTIEWAASQSWSNGDVGTAGLSYPGAVQWLAAMEEPPHLRAMAPAMTFSTPRNFIYSGGVFDGSWTAWIWNNIAPDARVRKNLPGPRTRQDARDTWQTLRDRIQRHLPLLTLVELREVAPWYYEWLSHPPEDPYWDSLDLRGKYGRVRAAVLNLSGWYDEAYGPEGALTNYTGIVASRSGSADRRARLIIGPWVHGVPGPEAVRAGEQEFGPDAVIDYDETVLRWMDRHVRGIDDGGEPEKPVRLFVMGANRWLDSAAFPLPDTKATALYLATGASRGRAGLLDWNEPGDPKASSAFVSDPGNPVTDPHPPYTGGHDYRVLASRSDVLVWETLPLESEMEIVGPIRAEIHLSCDAPDTDLWVRLHDVHPDGSAINLMSPGLDVLRASYRNPARRELLEPGRVYKLTLDNLVTGNLFKRGHRIRVQISAAFFPSFSRNLHTGEPESRSGRMRKARITIHHDRERPSRIVLPLRTSRD